MKQVLLFLFLSITLSVHGQTPWNEVINVVKSVPAVTPSADSVFHLNASSRAAIARGEGQWVAASSGGSLTYYELECDLIMVDGALVIDTIYLNTFPGTWTTNETSTPHNGFELNCDCDEDVDFAGQHIYNQFGPSQVAFWYNLSTPVYFSYLMYRNGAQSIGVEPHNLSDGALEEEEAFDDTNPKHVYLKWYHGN